MSEMIGRAVAAGLAELRRQAEKDGPYVGEDGLGHHGDPEGLLVDGYIDLRAIVRAVIAAMHDPPEGVLEALNRMAQCEGYIPDIPEIWNDAIDAALAD